MMEYQVKIHGTSQIEVKVSYPLINKEKYSHFRMTAVFFIPEQLGVHERAFPRERLLSDLSVYTRFTTPRISLSELLSKDCESSPLTRLNHLWSKPQKSKSWRTRVIYELKTLVNIVLSETGSLIEASEYVEPEVTDAIIDAVSKLISAMHKNKKPFPGKIKQPLIWTLEDLGKDGPPSKKLNKRFESSLNRILHTRKKYGWDIPVDPHDFMAERMVYRSHKLKKWAQESLFLSVYNSRAAASVAQFLLGLAAAVAMAFAVTATILSMKWFPQGSMYWALIAVIAYSLKDRIKENLRSIFLGISPFLVADRLHRLVDPRTDRRCGKIRESVSFSEMKKLNEDIKHFRRAGKDKLSLGLLHEKILKYKKDYIIHTVPLFENHTRLSGITDIVRLDMSNWVQKMDDSIEYLSCRIGDEYGEMKTNRVYHVNMVLKLERPESKYPDIMQRYRIIMARKGILRIEEVNIR
ncbi:hypothetical protein EXM22_15790 [Oceanispirochaeta crateris]|uniref:Uncharacterized protein n=1 Tax=Oceanispirochaeta crateris TaxID=2518645 RepID=A0A5C1QS27_9SPIO|nr:hypothetical protein [Oceanispirochaeta crateris]QEN09366.1 hypothetical protein EXM22_15790 [Oceanispirochaeta crateris]